MATTAIYDLFTSTMDYSTLLEDLNGTTESPHTHSADVSYEERIVIGILLIIICLVGLFGNSLTIFAVVISTKLRTTTNVFVVHLAVADLLTCLFQPWDAIGLWSMGGWPLPHWICTVSSGISLVCLSFTVIDLAFIAVNRYHKILYPLRTYQMIYSTRNIVIMLICGWLYCFFVVILPPCFGVGAIGYSFDLKTCASDETNPMSDIYTGISAVLIYPIPLFTVVFCYTKIFLYVRRHQKVINMRRKSSGMSLRRDAKNKESQQIQITKNLMYVVIAFLLCLGPYVLAVAIVPLQPLRHWAGLAALFNSCVNPFIYGLKHPGFREVFGYILKGKWKYIPEPASFVHQFRSTQRGSASMKSPRSSLKDNDKNKINVVSNEKPKSPTSERPTLKDSGNKVSFANEDQMKATQKT